LTTAAAAATAATTFAHSVAQADASFSFFARGVVAALFVTGGAILALAFGAVGAGGVATGGVAAGGVCLGGAARVVLFLVLFTFLLAGLVALRVFGGASFLEFADFNGNLVAFDTETDGQFGGASLLLGRWVQDLVRVVRFQHSADFVAFRLFGQALFLAAFDFGFQVVSFGVSFESGDETVTIARILID